MADPEFDALRAAWQAKPEHPLPDLLALLRRRTRAIWLITALDVAATVALLGTIAWLARDGLDQFERAFSILTGLLLVIGWATTLLVRRGSWRLPTGGGVEEVLRFAIRRCRVSVALARINQGAIVLGVLLGIMDRYTELLPTIAVADSPRVLLRLGAGALFLLWLGGAEWYARRKGAERRHYEETLEELRGAA